MAGGRILQRSINDDTASCPMPGSSFNGVASNCSTAVAARYVVGTVGICCTPVHPEV